MDGYLEDFLTEVLEERLNKNTEQSSKLKQKYLGFVGEEFAYKYLKELFKRNDVDLIVKKSKGNKNHDLKIYINGKKYLFEVKYSTGENNPRFGNIHLKTISDLKIPWFLLLIWNRNNNLYFAILSKEEMIKYLKPANKKRNDDDFGIFAVRVFNTNFLIELVLKLDINKQLEDLTNEEKMEIVKNAENKIKKKYLNSKDNSLWRKLNDFGSKSGDIVQDEVYNFWYHYHPEIINNKKGDYDILYDNKKIELKFATITKKRNSFSFGHIKPELFDFILFIGLDKENKFWFEIKTKDEMNEFLKEHKIKFQEDGYHITPYKSSSFFQKFGNHLYIEDLDNYIKSIHNKQIFQKIENFLT